MAEDAHTSELDEKPLVIPEPIADENKGQEGTEALEETGENNYINIERDVASLDISSSQEETRAKIALFFTQAFLFLVVVSLILPFLTYILSPDLFPNPIENAKELLTALASILAGPFGFIVGFYFKQELRR